MAGCSANSGIEIRGAHARMAHVLVKLLHGRSSDCFKGACCWKGLVEVPKMKSKHAPERDGVPSELGFFFVVVSVSYVGFTHSCKC